MRTTLLYKSTTLEVSKPIDPPNRQQQVHEYTVEMTCEGCSGAVERVLGKLGGECVKVFECVVVQCRHCCIVGARTVRASASVPATMQMCVGPVR